MSYEKGLDDPGFECRQKQGIFLFSKRSKIILWQTQRLIELVTVTFFFKGKSLWRMNLTTYLHLIPRLGMSGAVPLLCLYASMAWTRKSLLVVC